jgi:ADP-heptose:LPS heptosyltransferase
LHPGAGSRRKRWPADRFAALADRCATLGYAIAATCGPADEEAVARLQASVRSARVRILAGLGLEELAAILAGARLFVGNDSGITHLAALVGTPTVAIFGPFDPAYWAPLGPRVAVVDGGASCHHRADPRDGCRLCDLLPTLDLEAVWDVASSLLAQTP